MDILTLLVGIILGAGALALIFYPLWQQTRPDALFRVGRAGQTLEEYQARYQALLASIRDLMFDYEMGKVAEEDYHRLLHKIKLEAAQVRQQIDRLSAVAETNMDDTLDSEIEGLVQQVRNNQISGQPALLREVEAEIEALKHSTLPADGLTCPNCGHVYRPGDAFCAKCGQPLPPEAPEVAKDVCPECGASIQPDDAFCAKCGAVLKAELTA